MRNHLRLGVAMIALIAGATAAQGLDVTGTWEGTEKCGVFTDSLTNVKNNITVSITQAGTDLNVAYSGGQLDLKYNGYVFTAASNPDAGRLALLDCNNSPVLAVEGDLKAKASSANGSGKLTGVLTATNAAATFTCKWTLKRTSPADPMVSGTGCP